MLAAQTTAMKTKAFTAAMLSAQLRSVLCGPSLPSRGRAFATVASLRGGSTVGDDAKNLPAGKVPLSEATMNPSLVKASYAVRGKVLDRAMELIKQLNDDPGRYMTPS